MTWNYYIIYNLRRLEIDGEVFTNNHNPMYYVDNEKIVKKDLRFKKLHKSKLSRIGKKILYFPVPSPKCDKYEPTIFKVASLLQTLELSSSNCDLDLSALRGAAHHANHHVVRCTHHRLNRDVNKKYATFYV